MTPKRVPLAAHLRVKFAADRETDQERHDDVLGLKRLHSSVLAVSVDLEHQLLLTILRDTGVQA